jgi:hypothetical protein
VQEVMYRIMNAEPVPVSELAPTLPRALVTLIERCLRKSPTARPSSTEELATLLGTAVAPTVPHRAANDTIGEDEGFQQPLPPRRSSTRVPRAAAILLAILSTGYGGWYARGSSASPTSGPAPAQTPSPVHLALPAIAEAVVASKPAPEMPAPSGSPATNGSATPPPLASSTRAPSGGHVVTSAARPRAASRFDRNNPYAE